VSTRCRAAGTACAQPAPGRAPAAAVPQRCLARCATGSAHRPCACAVCPPDQRWVVIGFGQRAALYSAGLPAGLVDQGSLAGFAGRPLLTVFGAVVVARLLVAWIVCVGYGLAAAVLSGCRGWFVAGLRHGAPSDQGVGGGWCAHVSAD